MMDKFIFSNMNLFKYVSQYVWGSSSSSLLLEVKGQLYDQYSGQWRCLFNESKAVIARTDTPHQYALVVSRVFEEGEEDLAEDGQDSFEFILNDTIDFSQDEGPLERAAFSWIDIDANKRFMFEFDEGDVEKMVQLFQQTVCECIYETKHQMSSQGVQKRDIMAMCNPSPSPFKPTSGAHAPRTPSSPYAPSQSRLPAPSPSASSVQRSSSSSSTSYSTPSRPAASSSSSASSKIVSPTKARGSTLVSGLSAWYMYNNATKSFSIREPNVTAMINHTPGTQPFTFTLYLVGPDGAVLFNQELNSEMYPQFVSRDRMFVWVCTFEDKTWTFALMFANEETDVNFKQAFSKCLWETNNEEPFKGKPDDLQYLIRSLCTDVDQDDSGYEDDDGMTEDDLMDFDALNISESPKRGRSKVEVTHATPKKPSSAKKTPVKRTPIMVSDSEDDDEDEEEEESEEEYETEGDQARAPEGKAHNSSLAVGVRHNRAFVTRGSKIGVFKTSNQDGVEYSTSIQGLRTPGGQTFSPCKVMLHDQDTSMLLLNPHEKKKVYHIDLNRPDVVQEWQGSEYHNIQEIMPMTKYAQTTPAKTFVGMNAGGFFMMDPRLKGDKIVDSNSYFYSRSTRPDMSCGATTKFGQLAVGTGKGEIKLFDQKLFGEGRSEPGAAPRAKTSLVGMGDPIKGIDVTEDGAWILATCKTYLMVIPAQFEQKGALVSGFEKAMGAAKPAPRRLQLRPEDIAKMGGRIDFTPAHFNTTTEGGAQEERSIVTSTGPFLISWNFRKVKQNKLDEYQIKRYEHDIVADQFKFGEDRNIIVAMSDDVVMAKKVPVSTPRKVA
eukprot:TRINITY_DN6064_c0_g1_i1.p1 TRINITY_DN6064_c0_g1~~TRINITY_DN6064_c0_g1_i1.p1  ORF type:complete len:831 (-),score=183.37 TRINITY_DN6064_c0_g1_i1:11-2503(-)